ncbi:MAG: glycosyltransferase family 9 protein [Deltaproteobacteria bacterium]|nr:glycosyltransferase family 9 protein [Deltaproteobacteria bacterium]
MEPRKIIFIRRDNIGDLVCTTPAIRAVRQAFPRARLSILVNTYNAEVIANHPHIDRVYVFQKPKHALERRRAAVLWDNFRLFREIRRERYDVAIGCGMYNRTLSHYTFFTGARRRIGYCRGSQGRFFYNVPVEEVKEPEHEVVKVFRLLAPLGITGEPGDLFLVPDAVEVEKFSQFLARHRRCRDLPLLGLAISARIRHNRWPVQKFISLIEGIVARREAEVLLLWAPGSEKSPTYPGDDESAAQITRRFGDTVLAYPTPGLKALIAALFGVDLALTLDTGSLHIAAAAKKPLVALMNPGKAAAWYPWRTAGQVLVSPGKVEDIPVAQVSEAVARLVASWKRETPLA